MTKEEDMKRDEGEWDWLLLARHLSREHGLVIQYDESLGDLLDAELFQPGSSACYLLRSYFAESPPLGSRKG